MSISAEDGADRRHLRYSYDIIQPKQIIAQELNYITKTLDPGSFVIIDLRKTKDFEEGHIEGALSIPFKNVSEITNIPNYQNIKIIIYSEESIQYFQLTRPMRKLNITNYYILQNGYEGWEKFKNEK